MVRLEYRIELGLWWFDGNPGPTKDGLLCKISVVLQSFAYVSFKILKKTGRETEICDGKSAT